jgi:hypothetical protein
MSEQKDTKVVSMPEGIDFNQPLTDLKGRTIQETDSSGAPVILRIGDVCSQALNATVEGDKPDETQKRKRFNLSLKIIGKGDEEYPTIRLNSKQKNLILEMTSKAYGTLVYGRVYQALEGTTEEEED